MLLKGKVLQVRKTKKGHNMVVVYENGTSNIYNVIANRNYEVGQDIQIEVRSGNIWLFEINGGR